MAINEKYSLERANCPEDAGVSSKAIAELIEDFQNSGIETHSIMILRHGKVAFESWAAPYDADIPHNMYSGSKSVTSAAVGFAVEEGLISLNTKVLEIFPDFKPKKRDENLEKLTVFHLITMTAGKDVSLLADKSKNRWIKDFFKAKWAFSPGESWRYISENTYMLSAIIARVTGMSMTEYLTPRLYEPLGFGRIPFWEKDGNGIEAGGWGLYLTTEELAKFTLCFQQGGIFNGNRVVPENWAREAVKKQVENPQYADLSSTCGYGYCFWMSPFPNSYRADGMFSQSGKVLNEYNASIITTASEINEEKSRECIWRHLSDLFLDEGSGSSDENRSGGKPALRPLKELAASGRSGLEERISNNIITIKKNRLLNITGYPLGMLTFPVIYMSIKKGGNMNGIKFEFGNNECSMSWCEGNEENVILCGMDGTARRSKIKLAGFDFTASSSAAWENENTLCVWVRPLEAVSQRRIRFVFLGNDVKIISSSSPSIKDMTDYLSTGVSFFIKNPIIIKAAQYILSKGERILEPGQKGLIEN